MDKIKNHVGIPKFLISQFENKEGLIFVYDIERNKKYFARAKNIGTEVGYYDSETEKLLSKDEETMFGSLISNLNNLKQYYKKTNELNNKYLVVEKFIKFQFFRSKKSLTIINKDSLSSIALGTLSSSDLIKISTELSNNTNLLSLIEKPLQMVILKTDLKRLITNSLGFYFTLKDGNVDKIIIPINPNEAIVIFHSSGEGFSHFTTDDLAITQLNNYCYSFEKACGNGFLIANDSNDMPE